MNPVELIMRRRQVAAFIAADQIMVTLHRQEKVATPAGGWTWADMPPLPPQPARMIDSKRRYADVNVNTEAGAIANWPYILEGFHTMDIRENDRFVYRGAQMIVRSVKLENEERTVAAVDYVGADDG